MIEHFNTWLGRGMSACRALISEWAFHNAILSDGSCRFSIIDEVKQSGKVLEQCVDRNRRSNEMQECVRWQCDLQSECLTYNE